MLLLNCCTATPCLHEDALLWNAGSTATPRCLPRYPLPFHGATRHFLAPFVAQARHIRRFSTAMDRTPFRAGGVYTPAARYLYCHYTTRYLRAIRGCPHTTGYRCPLHTAPHAYQRYFNRTRCSRVYADDALLHETGARPLPTALFTLPLPAFVRVSRRYAVGHATFTRATRLFTTPPPYHSAASFPLRAGVCWTVCYAHARGTGRAGCTRFAVLCAGRAHPNYPHGTLPFDSPFTPPRLHYLQNAYCGCALQRCRMLRIFAAGTLCLLHTTCHTILATPAALRFNVTVLYYGVLSAIHLWWLFHLAFRTPAYQFPTPAA